MEREDIRWRRKLVRKWTHSTVWSEVVGAISFYKHTSRKGSELVRLRYIRKKSFKNYNHV